MRCIILVFIIFGLSGLGIWYSGEVDSSDFILAIDSSGSMLADDFDPTRLDAAKDAAKDFIEGLGSGTNIGVLSFSGTAVVEQPLTQDKLLVKNSISDIGGVYAAGTAIGDALVLSSNIFEISDTQERARSVIILTDGQSNVGLSVEDAVQYAKERGVVVYAIGIGTEEGGTFVKDLAVSKLNYDTLEILAENTGGEFYLVESVEEMGLAYSRIGNTQEGRVLFDAGRYLLMIAFLFLLGEWILANTKYKTII